YSEIAAGSARLLGVRLMRNFEQSYGAANLRDFWRRWHISLTVWFTDYVYIPLGGSRRGMRRQVIATFVVFALCGLWHGADWSFVVWGLLHACFLSLCNIQRRFLSGGSSAPRCSSRIAGRLTMFTAVSFAWVFFRANNLSYALLLINRLFSRWDVPSGVALLMSAAEVPPPAARLISPVALTALFLSLVLTLRRLPALTGEEPPPVPDAAWVFLLLAIGAALFIRLDSGTANTFIYFQF
ncbi:MAG: MBOAT family O-acyltransferase, partial [bacterium]